MAKQEKLQNKRKSFKQQLSHMANMATEQLALRAAQLNTAYQQFLATQEELEIINEEEITARFEIEDLYYDIIAKMDVKAEVKPTATMAAVTLPKIQVPEFQGNYNNFLHFHDTFVSIIHNNLHLTNIQKFHYLISSLKGEAARVVEALEISDENYSIAWQLLKDRYENKKLITQNHIKQLVELQGIQKESYKDLRIFIDNFLKHYRALKNAGKSVNQWSDLLIYLMLNKLDYNTKKEWETKTHDLDDPSIENFIEFLQKRCKLLEAINLLDNKSNFIAQKFQKKVTLTCVASGVICPECKESHRIFQCKKFLELKVVDRKIIVKQHKLCFNCLRPGHRVYKCISKHVCKVCGNKHNSLLHETIENHSIITDNTNQPHMVESVNSVVAHSTSRDTILLGTAELFIKDSNNKSIKCRALLDSGSMPNFITRKLAEKLNIRASKSNLVINTLSGVSTQANELLTATIHSTNNNFFEQLSFYVVKTITQPLPQVNINIRYFKIPENIQLADTKFNEIGDIDLLLGAEIYFNLLLQGQISLGNKLPTLQNTKFGYVVAGRMGINYNKPQACFLSISEQNEQVQNTLEKFWKLEDFPEIKRFSKEEQDCEKHFVETYSKTIDNKFIVKLPLKEPNNALGNSEQHAKQRFFSLERKLQSNSDLYLEYKQFMNEYISLGHMSEINPKADDKIPYYIPQQIVQKSNSLTTKYRVVFDASAKSSSNKSLNDILMVGPSIQEDLFNILLRFRKHNIVILADITKMYRQILVHDSDRHLQRILYRENSTDELKHYNLNTITYGTGPASFLATRCLQQVAVDNTKTNNIESEIIMHDFYVDNLMTGTTDENHAIELATNIQNILKHAGFPLRQWMSNSPKLLKHLSQEVQVSQYIIYEVKPGNVLGMTWNPSKDNFVYNIDEIKVQDNKTTKRAILSTISKIFDPLGLLTPIFIRAKFILQNVWKSALDWDDEVPSNIKSEFIQFLDDLANINNITIQRQITMPDSSSYDLYGFCDASSIAYGACVYLLSKNNKNETYMQLICAKSRIAPLKTITIPRLELCAALLLAKLMTTAINSLKLHINNIYCFSDSTIVLAWIKTEPFKLKTFIANRVSKIQEFDNFIWKHVNTEINPADCITRGMFANELNNHMIWWNGPDLSMLKISEPVLLDNDQVPELKSINHTTVLHAYTINSDIFDKFSDYNKLCRITAYVLRFVNNCKTGHKLQGNLSIEEINNAELKLIQLCQQVEFVKEFQTLKQEKPLSKQGRLMGLNPFLCQNNIIRVGGRIQKSDLTYSQKHQIILPSHHTLTTLIIRYYHNENLHCGALSTLAALRQKFWPIGGARTVKRIINKCIICFKTKPKPLNQQMGQLPTERITQCRAFLRVGVDYAGPFDLKDGKFRNRKIIKCYICLFVCLATKAVHIELVTDLTTDTFLYALKRFVARRGLCQVIMSDNAKNYVGASRKLREIFNKESVKGYLSDHRIEWKFIPARSPHFGGIWEAGIKSTKNLLKKILTKAKLTFEEFYTVLTQIEAVLNSRPITPMTSDINDLQPLTPGHFLIGQPLNALPEYAEDISINCISRYELIKRLLQQFWNRWSKDYLNTLQQRNKWKLEQPNLAIDTLVILKEDNLHPNQWQLARVTEVHPGADGLVRAATVKTKDSIFKRAVTQLCPLPNL